MWVLGIVYGWKPEKIKRFKVSSLAYWLSKARKRMTVEDLIGVHFFLEKRNKRQNIWQRLLTKS
jgi:surfactin synthase thioesterase subunit